MPTFIPLQNQCGTCSPGVVCEPCAPTTPVVNIPGAPGANGTNGQDGDDGINAYTFTSASFVMPAMGANVSVAVLNSSWMTVGQMVYVQVAGYMTVQSKPTTTSAVLRNVETVGGEYASNAAAGTVIAAGAGVSPAGIQGPAGGGGGGVGAIAFRTITIAGADTVLDLDAMILCAAAGAVTLAMATAVGKTGVYYIIKRDTSMIYPVNVNGSGGQTIDGAPGIVLMMPGESITLISDGADWFIV